MRYEIVFLLIVFFSFFQVAVGQSNGTKITVEEGLTSADYVAIFGGISAIAVSASTIIVWKKMSEANKLTRDAITSSENSNKLIALELSYKLKPIIKISKFGITISDKEIHVMGWFSNEGKSTAKNCTFGFIHWIKYPYLGKIIEHLEDSPTEKYYYSGGGGNLDPQLGYTVDFKIQYDRKKIPFENHWLIFNIFYKFLDDQNSEEIIVLHFKNEDYLGLSTYDSDEIKTARKRHQEYKHQDKTIKD